MKPYLWSRIDETLGDPGSVWSDVDELIAAHPGRTLDHDPHWLEAKASSNGFAVRTYVCRDEGGDVVGYAPFLLHPSSFEFAYTGYTLWSYRTRRYALTAEPLLRLDPEEAIAACRSLLGRVRRELGSRDVLFVLGLPLESPLGRLVDSLGDAPGFTIMAHGPAYQRRVATVEPTLDEYLSKLGPKTRQDLRRNERRFRKQACDEVELAVYDDPERVDSFLQAVESVSRRTYQWNLLGRGIRKSDSTSRVLREAARRRWLRGYVLLARGAPVAFMIGYLYRGTYLSESIGYDPDWSQWSVGNVLHLYVMGDLASLGGAARRFDFMYGDNPNKERLSTETQRERNYYLVPDTLRWRALIAALKGFDGMTSTVSALLERGGVKHRLRRALRKHATRASGRAASGD